MKAAVRMISAALAAAALAAAPAPAPLRQRTVPASLLPSASDLPAGWTPAGPPENYDGEGLYGYIDGGSEIFLQYDFRRVEVGRYKKNEAGRTKDITLDVYRMGTPRDAFGIFSIRREGGERRLDLGGFPNWTSPEQAAFAAGPYFLNIVGFETTAEDTAVFLRLMGRRLAEAGNRPLSLRDEGGPWKGLPPESVQEDSIRYIKGPLAAQGESEILAAEFWAFGAGTEAASAKYGPDGRKLVLIEFEAVPASLLDRVRDVFAEYLTEGKVEDGVLSAKNVAGHVFFFALQGRRAALVFGKTDESAARSLLQAAVTPR